MPNSGPLKVLGAIGAMQTFVENFPMSILDLMHGPTYTSVFDFLIDVLAACNVSIQSIMEYIISEVFGIDITVSGGVETIKNAIANLDDDEQSEFLEGLEYAIKGVIMAILTALFSCSAVPMLPNKYMDKGKESSWFSKYVNKCASAHGGKGMYIPSSLIDFFGYLNVNPLSNEGRLYYSVEGGDKYYRKVKRTEFVEYPEVTMRVPKYDKFIQVYLTFGSGHADFAARKDNTLQDELHFMLSRTLGEDLHITVKWKDFDKTSHNSDVVIKAGYKDSELFRISPTDWNGRAQEIEAILINSEYGGLEYDEETYIYLDKSSSMGVVNFWKSVGNNSFDNIIWGSQSNETKTITVEEAETEEYDIYEYVEAGEVKAGESVDKDAVRVNVVPTSPDESSPDYIVSYYGLDPNTLYKSYDMNAFLWYIMNRSNDIPQIEHNKNMWDSRLYAKKNGVERLSPTEWNSWYNSKTDERKEFKASLNDEYEDPIIYPLLQFTKSGGNMYVKFPAQRYFKPRAKGESDAKFRINATIYRFNWEYLQSIKILKPKVILYGMFDALLNGLLSLSLSIRPSIERREIMDKLSTAIKKYIEAEDAEVEDCYFTFSNEEFDALLEDMLLSKYNATRNGGEANRAVTHDINDYIKQLDSVSFSSSQAGDTTKIMKMVTQVSATAAETGSIEWGLNWDVNPNIWKQLIWAICLPIIESLFTPQLILLFLINFDIMGIISLEDLFSTDQSVIVRLITNKFFQMLRSIISLIKDKLAELLWKLFLKVILPVATKYQLLKIREQMEDWIILLSSIIYCLPRFKFQKALTQIDDVNYADITDEQKTPENTEPKC